MSPHSAERYTAPIPDAWPGLLLYAQKILAQDIDPQYISQEGALALCKRIDQLDNEDLDLNMYYGQGLLMCNFAQLLQEPGVQDRLVQTIARKQLSHFLSAKQQPVLNQYCIEPSIFSDELLKPARQAAAELDPSTRLLVNALSAMAIDRRFVATFPGAKNGRPITPFYLRLLRDGEAAPRHLAENATAGAGRILHQAIKHCAGLDEAATLEQIVASGVLSCPESYRSTAVNGARVRLDEINDVPTYDDLFSVDDTGNLVFEREHLRAALPPPKPGGPDDISLQVLRQARLSCPAVRVPGLITLALELTASVMVETQKRYEAYQDKQRSRHLFALATAA
jgi:hypothetical protein